MVFSYDVLEVHYFLPDGIICLLHAFSDTSSVSSIASSCEGFRKLLALVFGILKLSLAECRVYYFRLNDYSGARVISTTLRNLGIFSYSNNKE